MLASFGRVAQSACIDRKRHYDERHVFMMEGMRHPYYRVRHGISQFVTCPVLTTASHADPLFAGIDGRVGNARRPDFERRTPATPIYGAGACGRNRHMTPVTALATGYKKRWCGGRNSQHGSTVVLGRALELEPHGRTQSRRKVCRNTFDAIHQSAVVTPRQKKGNFPPMGSATRGPRHCKHLTRE